jgi:Beta-ketoacyl synthase, N-terminal domain
LRSSLCEPDVTTTLRCHVAAAACLNADADAIARMRKEPMTLGAQKLPVSVVKLADEQSVLAIATVREAMANGAWHEPAFADWGVIAAPNWFGRVTYAGALQRYQQEGAWGVSPHLIPQQSLHALSGTISQALKIHGPNFGVGGGPNSAADAFLLAAALLADGQLPGLWLVLTGYETEWIPAADGRPTPAPVCNAAALALTPWQPAAFGLALAMGCASDPAQLTDFHLGFFAGDWTRAGVLPEGRWRLADTHWLEIEASVAAAEDRS